MADENNNEQPIAAEHTQGGAPQEAREGGRGRGGRGRGGNDRGGNDRGGNRGGRGRDDRRGNRNEEDQGEELIEKLVHI
ncbi:MAG TPA: 30S ribosomal protein S5, partial [Novosphingobium sp.]|nr:30S ribosomal protein S5 [Novosphingobium sp.]